MRGLYQKKKWSQWVEVGKSEDKIRYLSLGKIYFYSQAFHAVKFVLKYLKIEL
ncbi:hypothetical protein CHELV3228_1330 [Campylobacter helveticus]|nr:hypothetical protein CHELV3228_1330 [Campylobacter helveticus]